MRFQCELPMSLLYFHSHISKRLADAPSRDQSPSLGIADLVSAQAASSPQRIAAADKEQELTYQELNARASMLAQHLRTLGVGPEVVVGLCLPRSVAMVVGALGILKAGGAYLPLDPAYPASRIGFQLNDAQVSVVVTGQCVADRLPAGSWHVIALDCEGRQIGPESSADGAKFPEIQVHGEDLAYVIYTSGSTGQPKGVEITHGSLQNLVRWHQQVFAVEPTDRAAQVASPGFDAAVWELWPYLTAGASIYIPDDNTRVNPEYLRDWLVEHRITITFVPTPVAEQLMCFKWPPHTVLRVLLTGADTLRHYPAPSLPFSVVNNYGPTECTVVATSGTVQPNGPSDRLPSIGRPIANTQVYILDENLQQLALGRSGELYIGGAGLARGYRNRPDLTAERFVRNPFSNQPGSRLYRTGDMGYFLPDGQIAFIGRSDDQVKIRGYRVETNEIASVIDCHPMVQASVVVAREDTPGEKRLLAYIVPKGDGQLTDKTLREFLLLRLPEYMIPAAFYLLENIPLGASGKFDRNALPPPSQAQQLSNDDYVAPRTPVESRMATILAMLLRLEKVGVNENFFLLGGNSLLGAQVIARIRDAFGVELELLSLFNHPTVAELSSEIERLLVARLGAMSEDEAERLAAELRTGTGA
jgi:amino acid adenylation domain-containing protein